MKLVRIILVIFIGLSLATIIIGGGFGKKKNLPNHLLDSHSLILFAHRGVTVNAPENSYQAVLEAARKNFPAVELDIQYCRDNEFIVFHDYQTERLLGMPGIACELSLQELQQPSLIKADGEISAEKVPSLKNIISSFKDSLVFYFDMKRYGHNNIFSLAGDIHDFISEHGLLNSVLVASANPWFVCYLEYRYPDIITVLEGFNSNHTSFYHLIPTGFRPDFIACFHHNLNTDYIEWLKRNEMLERLIIYGVDSKNVRDALAQGIRMIIIEYDQSLDSILSTYYSKTSDSSNQAIHSAQ